MKNNGFTLIELLGVIIILALLTVLVFPNIINSVKNSTDKTDELTMNLISNACDIYISNHLDNFPKDNGNKFSIELVNLVNEDLLASPIKYGDLNDITNTKCVQVTYNNGEFSYELKNNGECEVIYKICKLQEGNSKTVGSKYTCRLDKKRTFYVLENNQSSDNISLIMDENYTNGDGTNGTVPPTVTWCTSGTNNTACVNINDIYVSRIQTVFNTPGVTVSFPSVEQLALADGKNYLDYPILEQQWLYGNLNSDSIPYGYWTASPDAGDSTSAWFVRYNGRVNTELLGTLNTIGVRPVITIPKTRLD